MERSVGQRDHSYAHGRLYAWFDQHGNSQFEPFLKQDIQIGPDRLRTADLVVVKTPRPRESIFTSAPYLCIEVASPQRRLLGRSNFTLTTSDGLFELPVEQVPLPSGE